MTGHLLGGAGGLEAGIGALAVHHQIAPPTINLDAARSAVRSRLRAARRSAPMPIRYALSNSFGFGGTNAAVLLKRFGDVRSRGGVPPMRFAVCIKQVPTREWQPRVDRRWRLDARSGRQLSR